MNRTGFFLGSVNSLGLQNPINIGIRIGPGASKPCRFVSMVTVTFILRPKAQRNTEKQTSLPGSFIANKRY